ncbi:MAG: Geranylgeranyl pyrophosphate synthase [Caulobacter sp.]|nr:Geranylgeranyl pyrophosphate synthase [Caulobacter sp.]
MDDSSSAFAHTINALRVRVDRRLGDLLLPAEAGPGRLAEAARYALLAPGKRFRPMLTLLAAEAFGAADGAALDAGCAIEMVHAASLILDDLPCMDDAGLRRGRPTAHKVFGEATAILAAIGLLNRAYGVIAADTALSPARADLAARLSHAVGFEGLVAGQARDLADRDRARSPAEIDLLNHQKTGVLIMAAAEAGAMAAGAPAAAIEAVGVFARELGLAFQIRDDLIDAESGPEAAGKDTGKDAGMTTLVTALGHGGAAEAMERHLDAAWAALDSVGVGESLLAHYARGLFEGRKAAA